MKIKNNILTVLYDTNSNLTNKCYDFLQGYATLTIDSTKYLYIGYHKKINQVYIELKKANINNSNLSVECYINNGWQTLEHIDETDGLKKSGFIFLDDEHTCDKTTLQSIENCYYRLKLSASSSELEIRGINLVFCSMSDLEAQEPLIGRSIPKDFLSHIPSQVAARDAILDTISINDGKFYYPDVLSTDGKVSVTKFNAFDVFDINELRLIATYYTLYKIFSNRTDTGDNDVYKLKAQEYYTMYIQNFKLWQGRRIGLDRDNNGIESSDEQRAAIKTVELVR